MENNGQDTAEHSKSDLQKAMETADRIEKANAVFEKLLEKQERMKVTDVLSGRSSAGHATPPPPAEETPSEYKARVLKNGY